MGSWNTPPPRGTVARSCDANQQGRERRQLHGWKMNVWDSALSSIAKGRDERFSIVIYRRHRKSMGHIAVKG